MSMKDPVITTDVFKTYAVPTTTGILWLTVGFHGIASSFETGGTWPVRPPEDDAPEEEAPEDDAPERAPAGAWWTKPADALPKLGRWIRIEWPKTPVEQTVVVGPGPGPGPEIRLDRETVFKVVVGLDQEIPVDTAEGVAEIGLDTVKDMVAWRYEWNDWTVPEDEERCPDWLTGCRRSRGGRRAVAMRSTGDEPMKTEPDQGNVIAFPGRWHTADPSRILAEIQAVDRKLRPLQLRRAELSRRLARTAEERRIHDSPFDGGPAPGTKPSSGSA